jgi:ribosome-associated toxin RatA of RatAB toxin-antitoxin module
VLREDGPTRTVAMRAWRHAFPLAWVAEQTNDPATPSIRFHHVAGPTRGMDVEWRFTPLGERLTRVTIEHRLDFRFPVLRSWAEREIVAGYFIHGVAARTLARMTAIAESS